MYKRLRYARILKRQIFSSCQINHETLTCIARFRIELQRMQVLWKTVLENEITFKYLFSINFEKSQSLLLRPDFWFTPLSSKRNFREAGRCFAAVRTGSNVVPRERCAGTPPRNILCPPSPKLWAKRAGMLQNRARAAKYPKASV